MITWICLGIYTHQYNAYHTQTHVRALGIFELAPSYVSITIINYFGTPVFLKHRTTSSLGPRLSYSYLMKNIASTIPVRSRQYQLLFSLKENNPQHTSSTLFLCYCHTGCITHLLVFGLLVIRYSLLLPYLFQLVTI